MNNFILILLIVKFLIYNKNYYIEGNFKLFFIFIW